MKAGFGLILACLALAACGPAGRDSEMDAFIDNLMGRMTVEEKIGQLNLPAGGDIVSGQVFETDLAELAKQEFSSQFNFIQALNKIYRQLKHYGLFHKNSSNQIKPPVVEFS